LKLNSLMPPVFLAAGILKGIHHGFFQSHSFQMREMEAALHYFVDLDAEIFRSRHIFDEFLQCIQIFQIVAAEHFPAHEAIEIDQVANHTCILIDWPADRDFEKIVMAMSVGIVAFAINFTVFFVGQVGAVKPVRG